MADYLTFQQDIFWRATDTAVLLNPKMPCTEKPWLLKKSEVAGQVVFRTSGTEGTAKFVCLTREALLASANAVNAHLATTPDDIWLGCLPWFHVGGLGIAARAYAADCQAVFLQHKWDPTNFTRCCLDTEATLTALVPTQVYDLVRAGCIAPTRLRAVLVGGGALAPLLNQQARDLGWPILCTYGMTATASQVATQALAASLGDPMKVLPIWETRLAPDDGSLHVRGPALLSGYMLDRKFIDPKSFDGWYQTTDQVILQEGTLRFSRRHCGLGKIQGELVSLQESRDRQTQLALEASVNPLAITAIALPDERDGQRLVWVCDTHSDPASSEALRERYNMSVAGPWRMLMKARVPTLPRTELGKLDERQLKRLVKALLTKSC